ncbi:MAG: helix-turn-helix domain-containing protein [Pseudomonadota bacterium]
MPNTPFAAQIALIAYRGVQSSAVLGIEDVLLVSNRIASELGSLQIACEILRGCDLPSAQLFDAIVLPPNLSGVRGRKDASLTRWIAEQHREGATVCSACAGAFWLGYAGLLDGRPATTHWVLEEEFRCAFPKVQLHPEQLIIDDHDIVTAGGVMAWVDLGLYLVRRWQGAEVLSRTCRHMLIDPNGREQRNYRSFRPRLDHGDAPIRSLQQWMEQHAAENLSLPALAERSGLSTRTLQRRFRNATGLSIREYLQELRIERAKGLLERTTTPVSEICWAVGYEDTSTFSRLFQSVCGVRATEYRRRFAVRERE